MSFGQLKPIIGGERVETHEFPFAVYLSIETQPNWHAVCGGTLVSSRHIITAGHCLYHAPSASAVKVGYGSTHIKKQMTARAANYTIHPDFNPRTLFNDIAVIELDKPVVQSTMVHRIPLYFGSVDPGQVVTTMGWGVTSNSPGSHTVPVMNRVDLQVADPAMCRKVDDSFESNNGPFICTGTQPGNKDECNGDSGSPAIITLVSGKPRSVDSPAPLRAHSSLWGRYGTTADMWLGKTTQARGSSGGSSGGSRHARWWGRAVRAEARVSTGDMRLVALTSYGDNINHDTHPPCGDPTGFGFSTHIGYYAGFLARATGMTAQQLEEPVRIDRLATTRVSGAQQQAACLNAMLLPAVILVLLFINR
ncbi:trypsin-like serine protease [Martensiomyces pterosporus]|nr:trypsin-like serine protease [Martensiomyces pterosporus]